MSETNAISLVKEDFDAIANATEISQKYLMFLSDGLDFGVKASYVTEIITNHHITPVPLVPSYVKGIINLRGQVIPIIDIRVKMGKMEAESSIYSCIIVLNINDVMIGVYVDTVSLVTDIDESLISPPSSNNRQELVSGMVSLPNQKTLLILDSEKLIKI